MAIGIKVDFVQLSPIAPANVPNGSLFMDSTNADTSTVKETNSAITPIGATGSNIFIKEMQADGAILLHRPVSKKSNGRIVQADSDGINAQTFVGYALAAATGAGDQISVLCAGANLAGALTGLGFTPGDEIFLSETSSYTNDPASFTGGNDSIIRVGIADCAGGVASAVATDLIVFAEVIARP